ncbi:ribonuclease H-like domain-containing protein [Rhizophagus irregularis DAOM 181602=DAOM 197198]|nr:ribonuclease H-like domain-containing protein [Rhizophagus irregularis DAOM 181602=DAOM 197198]
MRWIAHHIQLISSDICAALREEIFHTFTVGGNLKTSTKTRWSTAWDCCESLLRNENNIRSVLEQKPQIFARVNATKNLINDRQFWINVEQLRNLIAPVKKAVKDVEFQNTILADVFVELVKIAIAVQEIPTPLNNQFPYFLHPTYRGDNLTHNTYKKIILRKALEIWKQTGGGEKSAKILKTQMNLYRNQESPFDDDFIESVDTVKNWWSSCELKQNENHISILALKLHSITPHNASTERVFSVLNWYLCKRRNKMNISHLESLAQIHSFLIANAPGELNFINNNISQDEFTAAFNQIAVAMEEGIDLFEENDSFPVFDDDSEEDNDLRLQNENGLNLEISELIQLNVNQSGSINENQADINESRIEHGNKDFNIEDLLHDD